MIDPEKYKANVEEFLNYLHNNKLRATFGISIVTKEFLNEIEEQTRNKLNVSNLDEVQLEELVHDFATIVLQMYGYELTTGNHIMTNSFIMVQITPEGNSHIMLDTPAGAFLVVYDRENFELRLYAKVITENGEWKEYHEKAKIRARITPILVGLRD